MIIIGLVVAVIALGALLAWAVIRADVPGTPDAVGTQSAQGLAQGPVDPRAVRTLRFDVALRGYRMEQVDQALDRLSDEIADRDAEIARLRDGDGAVDRTDEQHRGAP